MPQLDVKIPVVTQRLEGDMVLGEVLGFPEFSCCDHDLDEVRKQLAENVLHWLSALQNAELHQRWMPSDVATFEVTVVLEPTRRPSLWREPIEVTFHAVRWPVIGEVHGEGLLLVPLGREPIADVVAIPDCEQTPEQLVGLVEGVPIESQFARRLAESGCRVIVKVSASPSTSVPCNVMLAGASSLMAMFWLLTTGRSLIGLIVSVTVAGALFKLPSLTR